MAVLPIPVGYGGTGITGTTAQGQAILALVNTPGLVVITGAGTATQRDVAGVSNRTTVTNGSGASGNPTVDISASYVGQATITTLGTITTGAWGASTVGIGFGGTGANLSGTGGASQVLKQVTSGANVTVGQLAASDLSNGVSGSGAVALVNTPTLITPELGVATAGRVTVTTSSAGTGLVVNNSSGTVSPAFLLQTGGTTGVTIGYVRSTNDFITGSAVGDVFLGGTSGTQNFLVATSGFLRLIIDTSGNTVPGIDNTYTLGSSSFRWTTIYGKSLNVNSATGGIGYGTGAGGTVTQATNRTTGVTLNTVTGQITTNSTSLAGLASASFTVTNSAVAATDVICLSIASGATTNQTHVDVTAVASGSFQITVDNQNAVTAETGAIVINFAVIKGVTS